MSHTSLGHQKPKNAERRLILSALGRFLDDYHEFHQKFEPYESSLDVVNQIPAEDLPYAFIQVVEFIVGDADYGKRRAWKDGLVWDLFGYIKGEVSAEAALDEEDPEVDPKISRWMRTLVLDAFRQAFRGHKKPLTGKAWMDEEAWEDRVDELRDDILLDYDFFSYEKFADIEPERARALMESLRIDPDYFSEASPAISESERRRLERVVDKWAME